LTKVPCFQGKTAVYASQNTPIYPTRKVGAGHKQKVRWFQSTTPTTEQRSDGDWSIPKPTWSVAAMMKEAERGSGEPTTSLETLAKRSLIKLDATENSPSTKQLRQDLNKMWNWIQQVRSVGEKHPELAQTMEKLTDRDIYDVPRGVDCAPVRSEQSRSTHESEQVWRSYLEPKTDKVGGHSYFTIPTKKR